jgi:exodeoxyribonuclease VII large subunit
VTAVLQDLAATRAVDVIIVARGGGSLADLFCFCDETLCRTVALLPVPVIASVGHHTDRTLLDDVAAVSCSTPTHAAESGGGLRRRRGALGAGAPRLSLLGPRAAVGRRARAHAARLSRAPPSTSSASASACTSSGARSAPPAGRRADAEGATPAAGARSSRARAPPRPGAAERARPSCKPPLGPADACGARRHPPSAAVNSTACLMAITAHDPQR